jgi:hypothetical protein
MRAKASCLPLLFCALALVGCSRRLPGPTECRNFALATVGFEPDTPSSIVERRPSLAARADEVTRQCLTTPWDYQLLQCLEASGGRSCFVSFQRRLAAPSVAERLLP